MGCPNNVIDGLSHVGCAREQQKSIQLHIRGTEARIKKEEKSYGEN